MKSAHNIKWHEDCLKNWKRTTALKVKSAIGNLQSIIRDLERIKFYTRQIKTAKKEGKAEFDSDKYLIKRKG
jgi:hypothetical protein